MHKPPILHKKLARLATHQGKLVIGIIGTHKGCGVTHLGILLANYLSEYAGCRTAFLECQPQKDIQYLQDYIFGETEDRQEREVFKIHQVTFHNNIKDQEIAEILGDAYDCVILDLGTDFLRYKNEFLRCDKRIIVSSLAIWKRHELERFVKSTEHIKFSNQWIYAIPFGQSKDINKSVKDLKRKFYGVPYEPDPFMLSINTIQLLQKLI